MSNDKKPGISRGRKAAAGSLAAIVGFSAAASLFVLVPKDESGRTVEVELADDGKPTVTHIRGKQYLKAYLDVAGIPTACDGIIKNIKMGQTFTEEQCAAKLERELVIHARGVMRCTPAFRNHPDKEAIGDTIAATVSLTYNIGIGGYCGSSAARAFNRGDWRHACDRFLPWNKARVRGRLRVVRGLKLRRERERKLCLKSIA
ncbi:glycoside hydrolase family protein [Alterisphingorhabdus coralli]|uniref:Lysozyme n=1 Tax=Alterisphingorhabdus coralli TaxID=3071408 RepID=A0AA97F8Y6_9SPHN|nr:glycoside hydrolase family protein [Parasphingorhabdus sp. SCSIO 66989]WOE76331.1 glycoside hydrolase family protein [Parasphingorhabdus sp. SCSIO 66989]